MGSSPTVGVILSSADEINHRGAANTEERNPREARRPDRVWRIRVSPHFAANHVGVYWIMSSVVYTIFALAAVLVAVGAVVMAWALHRAPVGEETEEGFRVIAPPGAPEGVTPHEALPLPLPLRTNSRHRGA